MPRTRTLILILLVTTVELHCRRAGDTSANKQRPVRSPAMEPAAMSSAARTRTSGQPKAKPDQTRPPPRRTKAATATVLNLTNAPGVKPLGLATAPKLPFIRARTAQVVALARKYCKSHWYGVYLSGKKLGYAQMSCKVTRQGGREVFVRHLAMVMHARMYNTTVRMTFRTQSTHATTGRGEMLAYESVQKSLQQEKSVRIRKTSRGWEVRRTYRAGKISKPPEKKILASLKSDLTNGEAAFTTAVLTGKVRPGTGYRYLEFDSEDLQDRESAIQLLATAKRRLRGVQVTLYKVEVLDLYRKLRGVTLLDQEGNWLNGTVQGTIQIRREEMATAKRLDKSAGDFGLGVVIRAKLPQDAALAKKLHRRLLVPTKVRQLKLELTGYLPQALRKYARHKVVTLPGQRNQVTITRESLANLPRVKLPVPGTKFPKELKATHSIEAKHPLIRRLARKALGRTRQARIAALKLNRFVYKYLKKSLSTNLDSALAIAKARSGDCTEHARLMVALCRAVGLPARELGGVTYVPEMKGFGYHAWVEVWVGRWISIDPSWNEFPANATHLLMGGPDDVQWIGTLGALKARVLDVVTR